jgi:hypothetical protein
MIIDIDIALYNFSCDPYLSFHLTISNFTFCIQVFRVILRRNSVNQFIFVMVECFVFFEVRTEFLNII